MPWLKGSSDYSNFAQDFYDILTGAAATGSRGSGQAGNGVTLDSTNKWIGIDATNKVIRSQTTTALWKGQVTAWRGMPRFYMQTPTDTAAVMQLGTPTFSGAYSGGTARVYFRAYVSTTNTVAGTLAGTVVTYRIVNADTGATVVSDTTVSGWTGTADTKLLAQGVSLKLTVSGSDQFNTTAATQPIWYRGYSSTYPQGVDYLWEAVRIDTSQTIVMSTTSGGSNSYALTTDYKVVQQGDSFPAPSENGGSYYGTAFGDFGVFSGIEWQAGGSPPAAGATYYLVSAQVFGGYLAVPGFLTGNLAISTAEFWDGARSLGRSVSNSATFYGMLATMPTLASFSTFFQMVFTSGTPSGSWYINYWISVKPDKIVVVLRGDPGNTGVMNVWTFQRATGLHTADIATWCLVTAGSNISNNPYSGEVVAPFVYDKNYWGTTTFGTFTTIPYYSWSWATANVTKFNTYALGPNNALPAANPDQFDRQWYLYKIATASQYGSKDSGGTYTAMTRNSGPRYMLRGVYMLANDNFSNLDELTDGAVVYLLVLTQSPLGLLPTTGQVLAISEE